jgi:hypothetical protein
VVAFLKLTQFKSNEQEDKIIEVSFNEGRRIVGTTFQCHYPPNGMWPVAIGALRVRQC